MLVRHNPLKTIVAAEIEAFVDDASVKLLIPSKLCIGWSMVQSGIVNG